MHKKRFSIIKINNFKHFPVNSRKCKKKKVNVDRDGLMENHYVNIKAEQMNRQKLDCAVLGDQKYIMMNYKRKRRVSRQVGNRNSLGISNIFTPERTTVDNVYTSMKKQKSTRLNESIPITINSLPVIPFWKSSFEIMTKINNNDNNSNNANKVFQNETNFDRRRNSWLNVKKSLSTVEKNYLTMKKKSSQNGNIYI